MVAKSHLDLGFTALAAEVEARYLRAFFPSAIATAAELRRRGGPQLVWTTGSWILERALAAADAAGDPTLDGAVARGDLDWHALPFTTHTELMDADLSCQRVFASPSWVRWGAVDAGNGQDTALESRALGVPDTKSSRGAGTSMGFGRCSDAQFCGHGGHRGGVDGAPEGPSEGPSAHGRLHAGW